MGRKRRARRKKKRTKKKRKKEKRKKRPTRSSLSSLSSPSSPSPWSLTLSLSSSSSSPSLTTVGTALVVVSLAADGRCCRCSGVLLMTPERRCPTLAQSRHRRDPGRDCDRDCRPASLAPTLRRHHRHYHHHCRSMALGSQAPVPWAKAPPGTTRPRDWGEGHCGPLRLAAAMSADPWHSKIRSCLDLEMGL